MHRVVIQYHFGTENRAQCQSQNRKEIRFEKDACIYKVPNLDQKLARSMLQNSLLHGVPIFGSKNRPQYLENRT